MRTVLTYTAKAVRYAIQYIRKGQTKFKLRTPHSAGSGYHRLQRIKKTSIFVIFHAIAVPFDHGHDHGTSLATFWHRTASGPAPSPGRPPTSLAIPDPCFSLTIHARGLRGLKVGLLPLGLFACTRIHEQGTGATPLEHHDEARN